eukprot:TRINITY_DN31069_c0_g1_i1.p1 TRINITY_DN31069_c0_g1~~TRINITY_DN31069_c0_g1_i1.p1  ORF type:complete len:411 (+),score=134.75 TRINITY_DN31069_c0_g1_i1:161-1234(+)
MDTDNAPFPQRLSKQAAQKLGAAAFYFVMAVAMSFINKAVLGVFRHNNTLLALQMLVTLFVIQVGNLLGVIRVRPMTWQQLKVMVPLAFFYNANVAFALAGLKRLNIPMYNTLKRLTPCVIWLMNGLTGRGWARQDVTMSLFVIAAGTIIAGIGDFNLDLWAYGYAFTSCLLQATYLLLAESGGEKGFSSLELLQYNAALSLPVLVVLVYFTEWEESGVALASQASDMTFVGLVLFGSMAGSVLNYSLFLCATLNTALTTTVVGVMKAVASTALGFVLLERVAITPVNFTGISVNTFGGCLYTYYKYLQKEEKQTLRSPSPQGGGSRESLAQPDVEMNIPHEGLADGAERRASAGVS